jgi:1,2-diacylglycerol 3-alpha-glucosyltransferase
MKILMTTDTYWPRINGVTVAVDTLRKSLAALGHEVSVLAPSYPASRGDPRDGAGIHRFPSFRPPMSPEDRLVFPFLAGRVRRLMETLRPDIVHIHTEFVLGEAGRTYAQRTGTPLVMTCHTLWEQYLSSYIPELPGSVSHRMVRRLSKRFYREADRIIVPSEAMRALFVRYGIVRPIAVIPTGVDIDSFAAGTAEGDGETLQGSFPLPGNRRILLYAGRVAHEKNLDLLLSVLGRILPEVPQAFLVIAGDGPARREMESQVAELGLGSSVLFTGFLNRSALSSLYSMAEVFCFASKTETQGLVLLEAMAHGVPFVALSHGGTADILVDGRGGFVAEEDPDLFAGKVLAILEDRALRERLGRAARAHAGDWTASKMAERLLAVYGEAILRSAAG